MTALPAMSANPSPALPRRTPRAEEAARFLRDQLSGGAWTRLLPGETELARQLQVGRNTIRAALSQLEEEGLIKTQMGRRRKVTGTPAVAVGAAVSTQIAVLLLAQPYSALAPSTLLWMEALRLRLLGLGWQLQVRVESAAFRQHPSRFLESLTGEHPGAVWVLHRSTPAMQRWFANQGLRAVIAGSPQPGITLPWADTDYRAASRHAAARLTALGHRHLAVLESRIEFAGDTESVAGFREGAGQATVQVITHNDTPTGVMASLRQILEMRPRPTSIFVLRAEPFSTVLTWLLQQGLRIPGQMSLMCRDDEPFLQHLHPEPTRYQRSPEAFAKKLSRLITEHSLLGKKPQTASLIMPDFIKGGTVGATS